MYMIRFGREEDGLCQTAAWKGQKSRFLGYVDTRVSSSASNGVERIGVSFLVCCLHVAIPPLLYALLQKVMRFCYRGMSHSIESHTTPPRRKSHICPQQATRYDSVLVFLDSTSNWEVVTTNNYRYLEDLD
jgi:hypothetical protein